MSSSDRQGEGRRDEMDLGRGADESFHLGVTVPLKAISASSAAEPVGLSGRMRGDEGASIGVEGGEARQLLVSGQRFGEFEIVQLLGKGGTGSVYKGLQINLRRHVAIKILERSLARDAEFVLRFHNEAVAAAALNHPNLVQVYAAGETDGLHWFAMEFVDGESLQNRLHRVGRISHLEAVAIVMHVVNALDHAWRKGRMIHRDIKPDNIFLSSDGEVKLGDLGLAKSCEGDEGMTMVGTSMGTPLYISPEQAEGRREIDLRTDIYSLGATLFHLLTGRPVYSGGSAVAVMVKHVSSAVPDIRSVDSTVPEELAGVVTRMLQKAPSDRYADYVDLGLDLRSAYSVLSEPVPSEVISVPPERTADEGGAAVIPARSGAGGGSKRVGLLTALALGVGCAVFGVSFWISRNPKSDLSAARPEAISPPQKPGVGESVTPPVATAGPTGKLSEHVKPATSAPMPSRTIPKGEMILVKGGLLPKDSGLAGKGVGDFYLGKYEVMLHEWKEVVEWASKKGYDIENKNIGLGFGEDHPVHSVSWMDALKWCNARSEKEGVPPVYWSDSAVFRRGQPSEGAIEQRKSAGGYRLPTEAEWEWAARGGGKSRGKKYSGSDDLDEVSWHSKNSEGSTHSVGGKEGNELGIYDMSGNVAEWCWDSAGSGRRLRGGGWSYGASSATVSGRDDSDASTYRYFGIGFRVSRGSVSQP